MKKAIPFLLIGVLVLFVVLVQFYFPKPMNWKETFEENDKNPYGDFILYDFMEDLFLGKKIEVKKQTVYEVLDYYDYAATDQSQSDSSLLDSVNLGALVDENQDNGKDRIDTSVSAFDTQSEDALQNLKIIPDIQGQSDSASAALKNYIFINSSFAPGETDAKALLDFVDKGNTVFIAAQEITGVLADSLKIELKIGYYEQAFNKTDLESGPKKDSIYLTLLNTKLTTYNKKYWYRDGTVTGYFSAFDTSQTVVLGKNSNGQASFICVSFGAGVFLISSTPLAYTNYNMLLANNAEFISASLSYLPVRDTYWDEYYKNFREIDSNTLRFIESQPPLFWAYYIALISSFIYIIFEAKRRQRIIPIVEPPKNTTVAFVRTIGRMYFQNGNHKDIASKKIYYFLEYIRTKFFLTTTIFDKEFIDKIVERSGMEKGKVSQLFALIQHIQKANSINQSDLMELNKRLEEFKNKE